MNVDKIRMFHEHLRSSCDAEKTKNSLKKFTEANFSNLASFIFVIYLLKEVYRKIMSEIHFVGKTRYEDLTETDP